MRRETTVRKADVAKMTTGERVCAFIEEYCRVPEGAHVGKRIKLDEFQRKFIIAIYDNPHGTNRAYLSIARKNGKTALIAGICLAHIAGPVAQLNSQLISGAQSRDQAALVFKLMVKMIQLEPRLANVTKITPSGKSIFGLMRNVEYKAISAEAKTAHGLSPVVAILDELGQVRGPHSDFVDAVETSQGAHSNPLLIVISTQAASDNDLLSVWIDDALNSKDPHTVCHLYAADKDCDIMDKSQWLKSNPGAGKFRSLDDLQRLAEKAQRMPSFEPSFRNLNLNQRVERNTPFISRNVWADNGKPAAPIERQKVYCGLDLSSVSDLCAFVAVSEANDVVPTFWLPEQGIREKSRNDRVPYDVWAKQGHLLLTPGRSIQYEHIAEFLRGFFDAHDVAAVAFDRYNMKFLRPWLERAGFSEGELEKFIEFGQGFISMSPALRELESRLLESKLRHGNHPVLTMCAANAVITTDPAGNRKLDKSKATGRIDGMVSLAMAIGAMPEPAADDKEPKYHLSFA
jgi:phage terminase large subunit-like protein